MCTVKSVRPAHGLSLASRGSSRSVHSSPGGSLRDPGQERGSGTRGPRGLLVSSFYSFPFFKSVKAGPGPVPARLPGSSSASTAPSCLSPCYSASSPSLQPLPLLSLYPDSHSRADYEAPEPPLLPYLPPLRSYLECSLLLARSWSTPLAAD